ncbi:hypothetical protein PVAND_016100 [Polypedilum vanderplanki]|uniref:Uncharacterized protein n=1 Tax=Polypedilum vanderplanki TaxID=319348 RepID=A0A9J6BE49_POLVA|nr:hypothetical protein PVAND_016100 [Polypedilum vanderplanki]
MRIFLLFILIAIHCATQVTAAIKTTTAKPITTVKTTTTKVTKTTAATTQGKPKTTLEPPAEDPSQVIYRECAYWMTYNRDSSPETIGFYAGDSIVNNASVYIGWGFHGNERLPARIQTINTTTGTAPYTQNAYVWRNEAEHVALYPEFLVLPENCNCSWQPPSVAMYVRGLILTGDLGSQYAIGRVVFSNGLVSITRVVTDPNSSNYLKQWYVGVKGVAISDQATQMLVCQSVSPHTTPPIIKFPTNACGVWSPVGSWQSVNYTGFDVGRSKNGNRVYIGRGLIGAADFFPGRYQMEHLAGTYVASGGDTLAKFSEWFVLPVNCKCTFKNIADAKASLGLITVPNSNKLYGINVVNINSQNDVTVSRVDYFSLDETFVNNQNKDQTMSANATRLLVCELS